MIKEEQLKHEAEEYFKSICGDYNEEYERTGKRHYFVGFDIKNAYLASAELREKRIAELEEENAELKEKNNNLVESSKTIISLSDEIEARTMKQLTEAKAIIKNLMKFAEIDSREYEKEYKEAEKFLKECE